MSTIKWNGGNGNWSTAADWAGGVVPGANDTALISASGRYVVTIDTPVTVGGLNLDDKSATLLDSGSLTTPNLVLTAGTLLFEHGSLSGTVTEGKGKLAFDKGDTTFTNVTWRGALPASTVKTSPHTTLTISNGLTLTGANGTGPGTASFNAGLAIVLNNVSLLDNASISEAGYFGTISVTNTPTLTLGTHLTLANTTLALAANETAVNNGTGSTLSVSGGTFVNNGLLTAGGALEAASFTNNGTITETAGAGVTLALAGLQAPGANGTIILNNGFLYLDGGAAEGTLTTPQITAILAAQHVSGSGSFGIGLVNETLNNAGQVLTIGTGTQLGDFATGVNGAISGGTVIDEGGQNLGATLALTGVALQSANATEAVGSGIFTNVTLTGATALSASYHLNLTDTALSGVGTISASAVWLNGVTDTGVNGSGTVNVDSGGYLFLGAGQSTQGYNIVLSGSGFAQLDTAAGAVIDGATISTCVDGAELQIGSAGALTIGASSAITLSPNSAFTNSSIYIDSSNGGSLQVDCNITASGGAVTLLAAAALTIGGTITAGTGGTLNLGGSSVINNGDIIASGGTLQLGDPFANNGTASAANSSFAGAVTGTGTIVTTSNTGTVYFGATVSAGQHVVLSDQAQGQTLKQSLGLGDASGFAGTLSGFAAKDHLDLYNESVTGASFVGDSIVATLTGGGSITLATSSALTGVLTTHQEGSTAVVTYSSAEIGAQDWSALDNMPRVEAFGGEMALGTLANIEMKVHDFWSWVH